ncbi:hypothetical protein CFY87_05230 [Actinobacillus seminis]|uniref:Hep_Hag n=1 Tax=Actinobacillus seminis TaxID=722 RepID=A0A263HF65_9PAST|nr:hypothetical protein [Actinobacillus seminis]OZN25206.1 hypothetical protein CFY87_05230 [Actinobacillus seminis]SUU33819.1 Hep_Hag [Actinobacillus seminis]
MVNVAQAAWLYLENGCVGSQLNDNGLNESTIATYEAWNSGISKDKEMILLSSAKNKTGEKTKYTNKDFDYTVVIGSRAVGGGKGATSIGYRAIVGINESNVDPNTPHEGTAVGYRSFARGKESTALGNDVVAWGDSAIAIGSDNVPNSKKGLSKDVWKLYYDNRKDFNYTNEYAAVKEVNSDYSKYIADPTKFKTHTWARGNGAIAIGSRSPMVISQPH